MRRIYYYTITRMIFVTKPPSPKFTRLQAMGLLNPHPERVKAPWFLDGSFFDPLDLVQVRYEMLRHAQQEGVSKAEAADLFGVSRPTFYHLEAAYAQEGFKGLQPRQRGPKEGTQTERRVDGVYRIQPTRASPAGCPPDGPAHPGGARRVGPSTQHRTRLGAEKKTLGAIVPDSPGEHLTRYETLRARVVKGAAHPSELATMAFHGMLRGLDHLAAVPDSPPSTAKPRPRGGSSPLGDVEFVNVLTNIVLRIQAEASHVY